MDLLRLRAKKIALAMGIARGVLGCGGSVGGETGPDASAGGDGGLVSSGSGLGEAGGSGSVIDGNISGVAPSTKLNALSPASLQTLCDWSAQQQGGYGAKIPCDASGGDLEVEKDQATCVATISPHFSKSSCTVTVGDWMMCLKWRLSNWCSADPPAPTGPCAALQTGCYGSSSPDAGGDVAMTLPACVWPTSLNPADAPNGQCVAARVYLSCAGSNGGGEGCLSNDPTMCPGPNATPGVTYSNCQNQCQANEYAIVCGFIGPPPQDASTSASNPPSGCRMVATNPSGREPYCCPCGS